MYTTAPQPRKRVRFYAGRISPRRDPRPCNGMHGPHEGPLLRTDVYDAVEGWLGMGDCRACGSTIHRSQLRGAA